MDIRWIAAGITVAGVGVAVALKVGALTPSQKKALVPVSFMLMMIGVGIALYGFFVGGDRNTPSSIQMNLDSPGGINALGDVIINPDQARRITKEDEFKEALRVVGPAAIRLEGIEDKEALFLYGQLDRLLIASGWTTGEKGTVALVYGNSNLLTHGFVGCGMTNHLYYGDNLGILREEIKEESVDLIYLDPPFNSQARGLGNKCGKTNRQRYTLG